MHCGPQKPPCCREQATRAAPKNLGGQQNYGNVLLDLGEGAKAEAVFSRLVRLDPRNAEYQRQVARALAKQNKLEPALMRFRQAVTVKPDAIDAWLDMIGVLGEEHRTDEAEAQMEKALAANPGNARLLEGKTMILRRTPA